MPSSDPPGVLPPNDDQALTGITSPLAPLPGDARRQAVPSIQGTVYQAWWSIDAWLRLTGADELIYLEGAEDFDIVKAGGAIAVQVKQNTGSISLGNAKARRALENFWSLRSKDTSRRIDFHYLTTSSIATEQDAEFDGLSGIEAWRVAQTNTDFALQIGAYLKKSLGASSSLRTFLATATPEQIQERLIQRFHWLTDQPDLDSVKRSVNDRISVLLEAQGRSVSLTGPVRKHLESRFWEVVLEPTLAQRCLTRGDLLRQVEVATTTYLPVAVDQLPDLLGNARPGLGILNLLLEKSPRPPEPLLQRPALTQRLEQLVRHRKVVLLTGTVHKGKTTVAQLVASTLCPEAWWVNLTDRRTDQVDNVLLALAGRIDSGDCPSLVIIDDLDMGPAAHRVYQDSLALVIHRAHATGRGVLLTARGISSNLSSVQHFRDFEILDVPELSEEETLALCVQHGCAEELAPIWASFISASTKGHPKLVQVRLAELTARGWPKPNPIDLTNQSSGVTSARQMARQLLSDSVLAPVAEFVYLVSECSVLLHRSVAMRLAEGVPGLTNAGDILDSLAGKWIERIENDWFRATALLQGVAAEAWSPEKRKQAHLRLHGAILAKGTLDPSEAAALLFHAYVGNEPARLAITAMRLQLVEGVDARRAVERHLLWLPFVALEAEQSIISDPMAATALRSLQFRVALTLDTDTLPQICARWAEEIERIQRPEVKPVLLAMMWLSVGFAWSLKIPLIARLNAIAAIPTLPDDLLKLQAEGAQRSFKKAASAIGLPVSGTTAQAILLCAIRNVRDLASLRELVHWLDSVATDEVRQEFDSMLEWPVVQTSGAFVQSAWAAKHEETEDWALWLALLTDIDTYAKQRNSHRFGREAAKAKATILTEHLGRSEEALAILDQAEAAFGPSAVLLEQRANLRFQVEDDEMVLDIWSQLVSDPASQIALDPFAYRRAGISAARLRRWDEAEKIFLAAADSIEPPGFEVTKFGLQVDAALAISLGANQAKAAEVLAKAVIDLPAEASDENNDRWEAVQRVAVEVCRTIEDRLWRPGNPPRSVDVGFASSPALKVPKPEPRQGARTELTRAQILHLAATLSTNPADISRELDKLTPSKYVLVRWCAQEGRLALAYAAGADSHFIEKLVAFDEATADISIKRPSMHPLEPDSGVAPNLPVSPERWLGMLIAAVVCSEGRILFHLQEWLEASRRILGEHAALVENIKLVLDGASRPDQLLTSSVADDGLPAQLRCGAAAKLLLEPLSAEVTLHCQRFLASALVSDGSYIRQELFNRHVARRFAKVWRIQAQSPFQFESPRETVPQLFTAIDDAERGSGTLKKVLFAAATALGQPLGEFMQRVY